MDACSRASALRTLSTERSEVSVEVWAPQERHTASSKAKVPCLRGCQALRTFRSILGSPELLCIRWIGCVRECFDRSCAREHLRSWIFRVQPLQFAQDFFRPLI